MNAVVTEKSEALRRILDQYGKTGTSFQFMSVKDFTKMMTESLVEAQTSQSLSRPPSEFFQGSAERLFLDASLELLGEFMKGIDGKKGSKHMVPGFITDAFYAMGLASVSVFQSLRDSVPFKFFTDNFASVTTKASLTNVLATSEVGSDEITRLANLFSNSTLAEKLLESARKNYDTVKLSAFRDKWLATIISIAQFGSGIRLTALEIPACIAARNVFATGLVQATRSLHEIDNGEKLYPDVVALTLFNALYTEISSSQASYDRAFSQTSLVSQNPTIATNTLSLFRSLGLTLSKVALAPQAMNALVSIRFIRNILDLFKQEMDGYLEQDFSQHTTMLNEAEAIFETILPKSLSSCVSSTMDYFTTFFDCDVIIPDWVRDEMESGIIISAPPYAEGTDLKANYMGTFASYDSDGNPIDYFTPDGKFNPDAKRTNPFDPLIVPDDLSAPFSTGRDTIASAFKIKDLDQAQVKLKLIPKIWKMIRIVYEGALYFQKTSNDFVFDADGADSGQLFPNVALSFKITVSDPPLSANVVDDLQSKRNIPTTTPKFIPVIDEQYRIIDYKTQLEDFIYRPVDHPMYRFMEARFTTSKAGAGRRYITKAMTAEESKAETARKYITPTPHDFIWPTMPHNAVSLFSGFPFALAPIPTPYAGMFYNSHFSNSAAQYEIEVQRMNPSTTSSVLRFLDRVELQCVSDSAFSTIAAALMGSGTLVRRIGTTDKYEPPKIAYMPFIYGVKSATFLAQQEIPYSPVPDNRTLVSSSGRFAFVLHKVIPVPHRLTKVMWRLPDGTVTNIAVSQHYINSALSSVKADAFEKVHTGSNAGLIDTPNEFSFSKVAIAFLSSISKEDSEDVMKKFKWIPLTSFASVYTYYPHIWVDNKYLHEIYPSSMLTNAYTKYRKVYSPGKPLPSIFAYASTNQSFFDFSDVQQIYADFAFTELKREGGDENDAVTDVVPDLAINVPVNSRTITTMSVTHPKTVSGLDITNLGGVQDPTTKDIEDTFTPKDEAETFKTGVPTEYKRPTAAERDKNPVLKDSAIDPSKTDSKTGKTAKKFKGEDLGTDDADGTI